MSNWNIESQRLLKEMTERYLTLIESDNETFRSISYLDEAIDYVESCGYRVEDSSLGDNIVENLQLEELVSNFLSADFTKREEILKIK